MTSSQFQYLSVERAAEFIGDHTGVNRLLITLKETLDSDLPAIQQRLDKGDRQGVNDLLHQFKGFAPVFCTDDLVQRVVEVEAFSKSASIEDLRAAMSTLMDQLLTLQAEVHLQLNASER